MLRRFTGERWLGLIAVVFALVLMLVWIPLDVDTGLVEKVRRQSFIKAGKLIYKRLLISSGP